MALRYANMGATSLFRSEIGYTKLEKRQLFLRSYKFSRKQSVAERIKKSFFRVKRVIWIRFRSARKLRKMLWLKLKNGIFFTSNRRRSFLPLRNCNYNYYHRSTGECYRQPSCFGKHAEEEMKSRVHALFQLNSSQKSRQRGRGSISIEYLGLYKVYYSNFNM